MSDQALTREMPAAPNGAGPPPPPPPEDDLSLLAGLRTERKRVVAAQTKVFVIPGYEDKTTPLACRYGIVSWAENRQLEVRAAERPEDDDMRELDFYSDQLIAACREFGVMQDGEFVALPGQVRYDARLTRGLGLEDAVAEDRARLHLRAVFVAEHGAERAPYAINDHHSDVMVWMRGGRKGGAEREADEEFAKN
jgi:hypothetical protein